MPSITFIQSSSGAYGSFSLPSHQVGDLLVIIARTETNTSPILTGATWTQIDKEDGGYGTVVYRFATTTSESLPTWNASFLPVALYAVVYRNVDAISVSSGSSGNQLSAVAYPAPVSYPNSSKNYWSLYVNYALDTQGGVPPLTAPASLTKRIESGTRTELLEVAAFDTNTSYNTASPYAGDSVSVNFPVAKAFYRNVQFLLQESQAATTTTTQPPLTLPPSPVLNQIHETSGRTYVWDGNTWVDNTFRSVTQLKVSGALAEKTEIVNSAASGTMNFDAKSYSIMNNTVDASANWVLNIRGNSAITLNELMDPNQITTVEHIVKVGGISYIPTGLKINGADMTVQWKTSGSLTAFTDCLVSYTYTIIKTAANTYTVLGTQKPFITAAATTTTAAPTTTTTTEAPVVASGLRLSLDAGNSSSYSGSGTTWTDLSGNGYNGTLTNGPTYSSANGGSIVFDGSDDYVTAGNIGSFPNFFTVEVWFKSDSVTNYRNIIDCNWLVYNGSYSNIGPRLEQDSTGALYWLVGSSSGGNSGESIWAYVVSSGLNSAVWHQAVIKKYGATLFATYYNGALVSLGNNISNWSGTMSNVQIGRGFNPDSNRLFDGNVAMVRIYNESLGDDQILANFNARRNRFGL